MSRRGIFHHSVRHALEKEGWIVTDDPLKIDWGGATIKIDLGAERLLAAEREGDKIAVEIKSFAGSSPISEFHTALGQFIGYRRVLRDKEPSRKLFLSVPIDAYEEFLATEYAQSLIEEQSVAFIVYHPIHEVIVEWKK
ncbi:MAG: element excision factor XisH family protein [Chloroflexota bacterium]